MQVLRIRDGDGRWRECAGLATTVPGLAIARPDGGADCLTLTHLRSGLAVAFWPPEAVEQIAQFVLEAIVPMGIDWTADSGDLLRRVATLEFPGVPHPHGWGGFPSARSFAQSVDAQPG